MLGTLAGLSGVALTATAGWLIVQASTHPPVLTLMVAIVGVRAFGLARPVLRYAERLRSHDTVLGLLARRRVQVYEALVPLVPGRTGRRRGDLLASLVDDVDAELDAALRARMPVRSAAAALAVAGLVTVVWEPRAALGVAVVTVGAAAAYLLARSGATRAERAQVALRARLGDRGSTGVAVATVALLLPGTPVGGPVLALLVLVPLALADLVLPVVDAGALSARTDAARDRVDALLAQTPGTTEPTDPEDAVGTRVDLVDVAAGWGPRPAFTGLGLHLPEGGRVALVGPSGCGKSTVAALLLRFLDPAAGTAALGSVPLVAQAADDVRRSVGLVDDDPHLFSTTVAENVRLARPTASDADVVQALRQARLGEWLDSLPEGLGTWVGEGHAGVSGGERARLAIARSLLADQAVLVLDEPTAAELAEEVLERGGRSVLWITHGTAGLDLVEEVVEMSAEPPTSEGATACPRAPIA